MINGKSKFIATLNKTEDICLVSMFVAMVSIIFFQVIMRYVFNNSLYWSEELGKFIFVWISWLGISIGQRRNEHIKITLLVDRLPYTTRKIMEIIADILLILICIVTLYYAIILVQTQAKVPYAGIKIKTSWGYLSLVLGCGFMSLRLIAGVVNKIKELLSKDEPPLFDGGEK